jgi:hypothetical protein
VKRCTTALVDIPHQDALILVLFFSVSDIELYTLYLSLIQSRLHSCLPLLAKNVGCVYDSLFSRSRLQSSSSRWISASTSADGGSYVCKRAECQRAECHQDRPDGTTLRTCRRRVKVFKPTLASLSACVFSLARRHNVLCLLLLGCILTRIISLDPPSKVLTHHKGVSFFPNRRQPTSSTTTTTTTTIQDSHTKPRTCPPPPPR